MCLIAKDLPKKCKKTIVVYKELEVSGYYDFIHLRTPHLRTPFRNMPIDSPLMVAEPIQSKKDIERIRLNDPVKAGFIHSFKEYHKPFLIIAVVKAYIPKGAYYIEGQHGDMASTKLILDPKDVYDQTDYKFSLSDRIKFFLWKIFN